jgi:hypothetical protein
MSRIQSVNFLITACRYIQAAAYPKDVVVLLDVSGSMKGLRIEIARATVTKILDTLTDDDFFNVILVRISYVSVCVFVCVSACLCRVFHHIVANECVIAQSGQFYFVRFGEHTKLVEKLFTVHHTK